jgi:5-methylcytosine-specific restriction endonuclease McrA
MVPTPTHRKACDVWGTAFVWGTRRVTMILAKVSYYLLCNRNMRRIWASPTVTWYWGEPNLETAWFGMDVVFGDTKASSSGFVRPIHEEDIPTCRRFVTFLREAKDQALSGGLAEWDRYLSQPHVREAEQNLLDSRSVKECLFFLDKEWDEGKPHDYVLYRDYVWTLDEDVRFDDTLPILAERLEQHWRRLTNQTETGSFSGRPRIPEALRHEVWRRDGGQCVRCGSRDRLEFDHIVPLAMGGSNTPRNIELLCESCNRQKGCSLSVG